MSHRLDRYESVSLLTSFQDHAASCSVCRAARSWRTACPEGVGRHERLVRDAVQRRARQEGRWWESLDLAHVSERHLADWLGERALAVANIEGIDTSVWQGAFLWQEAVSAGVGWAVAKASEGNGYTDPQWGRSVAALLALAPVLVGGSYHFQREDLGSSPQAEAAWYLSRHPAQCFSATTPWIFVLDAEESGGSAGGVYAFLDTVSNRIGYSCWFYSYSSWISSRGVRAFNRPLWIAWPNPSSPPYLGWPALTAVQWGERPFSVGQVDADTFQGDRAALLTLAGVAAAEPAPPPPPPPPPSPAGGSMISFRPGDGDRHDVVLVADGGASLLHGWSASISGNSAQAMSSQRWAAPAGKTLVPGSGFVAWDPTGTWMVWGAQATDGSWWYGWGDVQHANLSGWQPLGNLSSDLPAPGPVGGIGPAGPAYDDVPIAARVAQIEAELVRVKAALG
jgi:GH25 family lysozyme M1 (1,4-beta-N-acetylmuramidase)